MFSMTLVYGIVSVKKRLKTKTVSVCVCVFIPCS